jgi:hypothetical protein
MIKHKFTEFMPNIIEDGILYISLDYGTIIHNCPCGCGSEVNTPLSPTGWKLSYNGETITIDPSVGNWSFDCKSHYWIRNGKIEWAPTWDDEKIKRIRNYEKIERNVFYKKSDKSSNISKEVDIDLKDSPHEREFSFNKLIQTIRNFLIKF